MVCFFLVVCLFYVIFILNCNILSIYSYASWVEVSIFDTGKCEQNVSIIKNILLIVFFTGNLLVIPNKIINFAEV